MIVPRVTQVDARGAQGNQIGDHNTRINNYFDAKPAKLSVKWPHRVGSIPLVADFQERELESHKVTEALPVGGTAVLSGLGGIGKTQLAAPFAQRVCQDADFNGLMVWVTASSRHDVQQNYAWAGAEIGQSVSVDVDQAVRSFRYWLETTTRRWLVVLDDLSDPAHLQGLWPVGPAGQVLVTTRRRDAVFADGGRRLIEVGLYTPDEAVAYLRKKIERSDRRRLDEVMEEAADLAADLGYLPLALAQAAAFIHDRKETCKKYRGRLRNRRWRLSQLLPAEALPDNQYQSTVTATWSISIEQADGLEPQGLARPALQLASTLAPNGVPAEIFTTPAALTFIQGHSEAPAWDGDSSQTDDQDWAVSSCLDSLSHLDRLSLISFDPDGGPRAVRTHALVQRATLEQLSPDVLANTVRAAADALVQLWPGVESSELGHALRDCAMSLKDRYNALLYAPDAHAVLFRVGRSFGECGLIGTAVDYWEELAAEAVNVLGSIHPDTLSARHNLAHWRGEAGDPTGAATAYEQLLTDRRWVLGADHPDTLMTRNNLAYWRGEAGDPAGAATAFERLLADCLRALGADHLHTLTIRNNLARWRGEAGDAAGAATAAEQLLTDYLRALGADHPHTLSTRGNLALWRGEAGDPVGAAVAFEQLLADRQRVLGPHHPHTLSADHNLAYWRGKAEKHARVQDDHPDWRSRL